MSELKHEVWLQVSAEQGPPGCAWAVVRTVEEIQREAAAASLEFRAVEMMPGSEVGTAESALVSIRSDVPLARFVESRCGTVQWIVRSPFRPNHKRKNWFVGVEVLESVDEARLAAGDLRWETMRASGPGGQHVNRTESAVRVTHVPTGIQATAMEERSQHRIRKLAMARLVQKIEALNNGRVEQAPEERWRAHHGVERGNPVRVFTRAGSSQ
jgi:peptide chain release factor